MLVNWEKLQQKHLYLGHSLHFYNRSSWGIGWGWVSESECVYDARDLVTLVCPFKSAEEEFGIEKYITASLVIPNATISPFWMGLLFSGTMSLWNDDG